MKTKSTKALDNQIKSHGYVATIFAMMRKIQDDVATSEQIGLHDRAKELQTLSDSLYAVEEAYIESIVSRYKVSA